MTSHPVIRRACEVAVVGAGAVGMTLAVGLARAGVRTTLVGPANAPRPGRTVALLAGSVRLLDRLGLWDRLAGHAAPLAHLRIVDATGSLFRSPPVQFEAAELGLAAFGSNVVNDVLDRALAEAAAGTPDLGRVHHWVAGFRFGPDAAVLDLADGGTVEAELVVAADGRQSLARKAARIGVRTRDWRQTALTGLFRHERPHGDTSVEFHTREGPFTLVPLPPTAEAPFRSSLVWVMRPETARRYRDRPGSFAAAAEHQADRLFGRMALESDIGAFPLATTVSARLTGPRLLLAGEAAHALPPIGAQGLNLSFRDIETALDLLVAARRKSQDLGAPGLLALYERSRRGDVALRTMGVDALNGSLLSHSPLRDLVRGGGLSALAAISPLRRLVMRQGLLSEPAARLEVRGSDTDPVLHLTRGRGFGDQPRP